MKTQIVLVAAVIALHLSCATLDVERHLRETGIEKPESIGDLAPAFQVGSDPEIVERPVFVPEKEAPRAPVSGTAAVAESNRLGIIRPSDYSHAAMVYDYHPDWVYEVYAQPLRACDIILEAGETVIETPFISDSARWMLGAGVSYDRGAPVQHIYVKPSESSIEASLIINTDRRVYHIILRSYRETHMPIIRWRYRSLNMPNNYITPPQSGDGGADGRPSADPRFLSFNYRIAYSLFRKPYWLPELVFDDGSKTYITFPESVLSRELPTVFENRRDFLNYRVNGNLIIIDKLVENLTVKIEDTLITISKKRSSYGK